MLTLDAVGQRLGTRKRSRPDLRLPFTRPSILDPLLETEPSIDPCCCGDMLVLTLHNYPIALISGTSLEYFAFTTRLSQLRHRGPR